MPPTGIFGLPHGVLSSPDERIAFAIGIIALFTAVFWDGDLDLAPVTVSGGIEIVVALFGSLLAPPAVTDEWHVPVIVVVIVIIGAVIAVRRSSHVPSGAEDTRRQQRRRER